LDDITLTGATKGELTGSGLTRTLNISNITVENSETLSIEITNPSGFTISGSPQTAVVYRAPYVGLEYQGGIIAYIFQAADTDKYVAGETHGLIAATTDQSDGIVWITGTGESGYPNTITGTGIGTTSPEIGTGYDNTLAMKAQERYIGGAAQVCTDYSVTKGINVYNDWFLPSYNELLKLYENRVIIGGFFSNDDPYLGSYWSSTESGSSTVRIKHFSGNSITHTSKYIPNVRVRAVRYFW